MNYRPEVDGLRALAVLPVILFHAGFSLFSGGFVGVDIFFVISGYLITTILISELDQNKFSLIKFYERRARRILPALFFVMIVSLYLAWILLLPSDLKNFGQSLIAVSTFTSNIFFWQTSDYFATSSEFKPMLHTWSLAVEEQFYIFFPLLLMALWKFGKSKIFYFLLFLSIVSLLIAEYTSTRYVAANFFLLPTRAWELGIGSLVAFYLYKKGKNNNKPLSEIMGGIGLLLIFYSIFYFDKYTPFPSFYALVPTIGAALIILYASKETLTGKILSNKILVWIGLLSYSLYLWHQPILAFARNYFFTTTLSLDVLVILLLITVALAYLTWRYVEQPFRNKNKITKSKIFIFSGIGLLMFSLIGCVSHIKEGFTSRYSDSEQSLLKMGDVRGMKAFGRGVCFIDYDQDYKTLVKNRCFNDAINKPKVVVFGDSKAAHLVAGVKSEFTDYDVVQWTGASCRAFNYPENSKRCSDLYNNFMSEYLNKLSNNDILVIGSSWFNAYGDIKDKSEFSRSLDLAFKKLSESKAKVIIIGNTPTFDFKPLDVIVQQKLDTNTTLFMQALDATKSSNIVEYLAEKYKFQYYDPSKILCKLGNECIVFKDGKAVYFDGGHIADYGSELLLNDLKSKIKI